MATTSGWSQIMMNGIGTTDINYVQVQDNKPYWALFFIMFIIIGSFFMLNLFVGVVIVRFQKQKDNLTGHSLLTQDQQEWVDIKMQNMKIKPIKRFKVPENKFRKFFFDLHRMRHFDNFIFLCIILNTLTLPIKWYGQKPLVQQITEQINLGFTVIFTLEAIIKIIGLGGRYFKEGWNVFDLVIVLGSIISIFISANTNLKLGGATSIIRAFRVGRILRLIKRAKRLKIVFNTFIVTLPALANVGGLLFLLIYLYSILGVYLFADIKLNGVLTNVMNFQSFPKAFLVLFVVATGDGWTDIMRSIQLSSQIQSACLDNPQYSDFVVNQYQTIGCGSLELGYAYFYSYYLLVTLIFLNLFIAIILDGFEETQKKEQRIVNVDAVKNFRDAWSQFDPEVVQTFNFQATGFIKIYDLKNFLFALGAPLGFDDSFKNSKFKQDQFIMKLDLPVYNNFEDFLFIDVLEKLAYLGMVKQFVNEKLEEKVEENSIVSKSSEDEQDNGKIQHDVEMEMNMIAFNSNMNNIQALKEINKGERKMTIFKQNLNRDSHFTSMHQQAASVVLNQFRYVLAKKKLTNIQLPQVEVNEGAVLEKMTEENKESEEEKTPKKEMSAERKMELSRAVIRQFTGFKPMLSKMELSPTLKFFESKRNSIIGGFKSQAEIEQLIQEEFNRRETEKYLKSQETKPQIQSEKLSRSSRYVNEEIALALAEYEGEGSSPHFNILMRPHSNDNQIGPIKNKNSHQFKINDGTMGGTGDDNTDINLEELKKEIDEIMQQDERKITLTPAILLQNKRSTISFKLDIVKQLDQRDNEMKQMSIDGEEESEEIRIDFNDGEDHKQKQNVDISETMDERNATEFVREQTEDEMLNNTTSFLRNPLNY